jgi:hypothetical protein
MPTIYYPTINYLVIVCYIYRLMMIKFPLLYPLVPQLWKCAFLSAMVYLLNIVFSIAMFNHQKVNHMF